MPKRDETIANINIRKKAKEFANKKNFANKKVQELKDSNKKESNDYYFQNIAEKIYLKRLIVIQYQKLMVKCRESLDEFIRGLQEREEQLKMVFSDHAASHQKVNPHISFVPDAKFITNIWEPLLVKLHDLLKENDPESLHIKKNNLLIEESKVREEITADIMRLIECQKDDNYKDIINFDIPSNNFAILGDGGDLIVDSNIYSDLLKELVDNLHDISFLKFDKFLLERTKYIFMDHLAEKFAFNKPFTQEQSIFLNKILDQSAFQEGMLRFSDRATALIVKDYPLMARIERAANVQFSVAEVDMRLDVLEKCASALTQAKTTVELIDKPIRSGAISVDQASGVVQSIEDIMSNIHGIKNHMEEEIKAVSEKKCSLLERFNNLKHTSLNPQENNPAGQESSSLRMRN